MFFLLLYPVCCLCSLFIAFSISFIVFFTSWICLVLFFFKVPISLLNYFSIFQYSMILLIILFMSWFPGFIELSFLIFTYSSPNFLKTAILNSLLDKLQIFISLRLVTKKKFFLLWCHVSLIVCITWSLALLSSHLKWQSLISFLVTGFRVEIFSVTPARHSGAFSDLF